MTTIGMARLVHRPDRHDLGLGVSDPPTQGEVQAIADKLDELINTLRR